MAKRWRIHSHDSDRIAALSRDARVPAVVAQLLLCRALDDPDQARQFLDPKLTDLRPPDQLPGCAKAAELIHRAIKADQRIVVYGDYDVDGMTATALLWLCLKHLGADVGYYVPHRIDEGYGLNEEAIRALASDGASMLVTVDCGIASPDKVAAAKQLGMQVIVTDHHLPGPSLPDADAIVHPRLPGGNYPFGGLSGAGVALKLAWALCQEASGAKRVTPRLKDFLVQAVGLAALGTVADVVPLVDENRVLVHHGLVSLAKRPTTGLAALMKVAKLTEKLRPTGPENRPLLNSEDLAFSVAPRLNAAGRLGQPQLAVELLLTDRKDRAEELALYIDQLNANRQTLDRSIYRAANKQAKEQFDPDEDPALVLADRDWHPGVIGIVAGRLAEKYDLPVVLVSWDKLGVKPGVGSARSIPGFDLHAALAACGEYLVSHGGHAAAAGLKVTEDQIDGFRAAFRDVASEEITEQQRIRELPIDAEAPLSAFTLQAVRQLERLAPFGEANPRPLVCTSEVTLAEPPRPIGSGGHHLALKLSQHGLALRGVAFGGGVWADELAQLDGPIDIAFRPVINSFRGRQSVELHLVDWRPGQ